MTTNDSSTAARDASEPDYNAWAGKIERLEDRPEPLLNRTGTGLSGKDALEHSQRTLVELLGTDEDCEIEFRPERLGLTARTAQL